MAILSNCGVTSTPFTGFSRLSQCNEGGGLNRLFVADVSSLDLTAMALAANFDTTDKCISNFIMQSGGLFLEIPLDGETTTFTRSLQTSGKYLNTITGYFKGNSCERELQLANLNSICNKVFVLQQGDCTKRVIGLEFAIDGTTVSLYQGSNRPIFATDEITAGTESGDKSSQTVTWTWLSGNEPLCFCTNTIPTA